MPGMSAGWQAPTTTAESHYHRGPGEIVHKRVLQGARPDRLWVEVGPAARDIQPCKVREELAPLQLVHRVGRRWGASRRRAGAVRICSTLT